LRVRPLLLAVSTGAWGLLLAACGGGHSGPSSNQTSGTSTGTSHAPFPSVTYQDGSVLAAPQIVTVTFPGDALAPQLQAFGQSVASSAWWNAIRSGYCVNPGACVGDGPAGTAVVVSTAAASRYTDSDEGGASTLQQWLAGELASGELPKPDAAPVTNTIYALYFPASTTIEFDGTKSCTDFDGYHTAMTMGSQQIVYAVVNECAAISAYPDVPAITVLQNATLSASHEIAEAASDPSVATTGYYLDMNDPNSWGWNDIEGGEIADLCVDPFGLNQDQTKDGSFTAQRIWSIAQAASGRDPCNPVSAGVYFNAAPREPFLMIDVGGSATFTVDAFSTAPTSDWTLVAQDWSSYTSQYLGFSIAGGVDTDAGPEVLVNDGSQVQVTVTLTQDPGSLPNGEADGVLVSVSGDPGEPAAAHWWPFVVVRSHADARDAGIDAAVGVGRRRSGATHRPRIHAVPRMGLTRLQR
jgi:hypothetical protein